MEKFIREILSKTINNLLIDKKDIEIEIPREESFGDLSTPIAMTLAKSLKMPPRKIAEDITNNIRLHVSDYNEIFQSIDIAGPGFINFLFTKNFICKEFKRLLKERESFFKEDIGKGRRVQIEFVSANPTGPLHLGHGRGAALGNALSNLLAEAGYKIEKEYYINDAGRQVKLLGLSVYAKYMQSLGIDYPFPEDGYKGDYIEELARDFKDSQKSTVKHLKDEELLKEITDFSYKKMLEEIKRDLEDFGVLFDSWQSEQDLYDKGEIIEAIKDLKKRGYIYEKDGAIWFKSTEFKDDKDRVLIKQNGEYTYFAPDIAYHRKKIERGFDEIIDIWGADHHGYVPRIEAVIQALGYPKEHLRVLLVQMVTLLRAGKPVQMSKREGEFITLREVINEIGADTTKFLFLTRRADSHLEIDIEIAKAQSHENPVFYVQYAHARINSIFEKARQEAIGYLQEAEETNFKWELFNNEEIRIIKKLLLYPMIFRNAVLTHEPHRITFYLQELAGMFHPYYQKYRVISEDIEVSKARLALCIAIQMVLRHGLKVLGVNAPERM